MIELVSNIREDALSGLLTLLIPLAEMGVAGRCIVEESVRPNGERWVWDGRVFTPESSGRVKIYSDTRKVAEFIGKLNAATAGARSSYKLEGTPVLAIYIEDDPMYQKEVEALQRAKK